MLQKIISSAMALASFFISVEEISDFSSQEAMESIGLVSDNNFEFSTDPLFCKDVPSTSYCGYKYPGDGTLSYTFSYSGIATLRYGQSVDQGSVHVKKNDEEIDSATKRGSFDTTFSFSACDVLKIIEHESVINIHKLTLKKSGEKKDKSIIRFIRLHLF